MRYCPFHPEGLSPPIAGLPIGRKPAPGMILDLMRVWPVETKRSFLVGDPRSDMEAASAAGITGHLFTCGDIGSFVEKCLLAAVWATTLRGLRVLFLEIA